MHLVEPAVWLPDLNRSVSAWYFLIASVLPARRQTKVLSLAVVWITPPPRLPCNLTVSQFA